MEENRPSRTAQGAAMHRAAHQLLDNPPVFSDPLALRIIGNEAETELRTRQNDLYPDGRGTGLRALIAVRSRLSEDTLAEAVSEGVRQYVLLGAGLDTFAYRADRKFPHLRMFEVDHPATQGWKRKRLAEAGIAAPDDLVYAPVDFETETLALGLRRAGFDSTKPAVFAWLGVVPYLTRDAIMATLRFIAGLPRGTTVVFDYGVPPSQRDPAAAAAHRALAERVAAAGEPLRSLFSPEDLVRDLKEAGFRDAEDFDPEQLNARYFAGRGDGFRVRAGHLMRATV
ncbi:MAG: class I SAM-dependent methyltransferase [Rhizomicrobium sp.]